MFLKEISNETWILSDKDCLQRFLVFGERSKLVRDFWFYFFSWFLSEKSREKIKKAQSVSGNLRKNRRESEALEKKVSGMNSCMWDTNRRWPSPLQGVQPVFLHPFCGFTWPCHQPDYGCACGFQTVCLVLKDISLTWSGVQHHENS